MVARQWDDMAAGRECTFRESKSDSNSDIQSYSDDGDPSDDAVPGEIPIVSSRAPKINEVIGGGVSRRRRKRRLMGRRGVAGHSPNISEASSEERDGMGKRKKLGRRGVAVLSHSPSISEEASSGEGEGEEGGGVRGRPGRRGVAAHGHSLYISEASSGEEGGGVRRRRGVAVHSHSPRISEASSGGEDPEMVGRGEDCVVRGGGRAGGERTSGHGPVISRRRKMNVWSLRSSTPTKYPQVHKYKCMGRGEG